MRREPARVAKPLSPREAFLRTLADVCSCESCCQAQPWRRDGLRKDKGELRRRGALRGQWREMR